MLLAILFCNKSILLTRIQLVAHYKPQVPSCSTAANALYWQDESVQHIFRDCWNLYPVCIFIISLQRRRDDPLSLPTADTVIFPPPSLWTGNQPGANRIVRMVLTPVAATVPLLRAPAKEQEETCGSHTNGWGKFTITCLWWQLTIQQFYKASSLGNPGLMKQRGLHTNSRLFLPEGLLGGETCLLIPLLFSFKSVWKTTLLLHKESEWLPPSLLLSTRLPLGPNQKLADTNGSLWLGFLNCQLLTMEPVFVGTVHLLSRAFCTSE